MTSDAKIGLLLGLVFIFIIAFVINGLPSFNKHKSNNELTQAMVSSQNNPPGITGDIGNSAIINRERAMIPPPSLNVPVQTGEGQQGNLPGSQATESAVVENTSNVPGAVQTREIQTAAQEVVAPPLADSGKPEVIDTTPSQASEFKTYTVASGDSLVTIAKKFYGSTAGNKKATLSKLFEANRKTLRSMDEIRVGQKLIIPSIQTSGQTASSQAGFLSEDLFRTVESIGQMHSVAQPSNKTTTESSGSLYVVREGDNLWRIAADKLGNGNRYAEIAKLNAGTIKDQDNLTAGTKLKIPSR